MFKIDKINIEVKYKPFIIAEMSGNHNQSLDKALEIVSRLLQILVLMQLSFRLTQLILSR